MSQTRTMKASRLAALAAVALLASACANADATGADGARRADARPKHAAVTPSAAPSGAAHEVTKDRAVSASGGGTNPAPSAKPSAAAPQTCTTDDLAVKLVRSDGAAGSVFWLLKFTNTGDHACTTGPFAGVSYVDGHGAQVGSAADWEGSGAPVVLSHAESASASLQETQATNYPEDKCRPAPVKRLRVYPQGETTSVLVAHKGATACADESVHLLTLRPFHAEQ